MGLNIKCKTQNYKTLEENLGDTIQDLAQRKISQRKTSKATETKAKLTNGTH